jgi:hypothetical protein
VAKKVVVTVPAQWIRDAAVDRPGEFFAAVGLPVVIAGVPIPPATFGVWALLELLDCDVFHPRKEATPWGCVVAFYVAAHGRQAAPLVQQAVAAGVHESPPLLTNMQTDDKLTIASIHFANSANFAARHVEPLCEWLNLAFTGFAMLPGKGGGSEWLFGVEKLGGIIAALGAELNAMPEEIAWEIPMTVIGHAAAQKAKQNGTQGVARPKDVKHFAELLAEAKERAAKGLLHPWQEQYPEIFRTLGHETEAERYRLSELYFAKLARQQEVEPCQN